MELCDISSKCTEGGGSFKTPRCFLRTDRSTSCTVSGSAFAETVTGKLTPTVVSGRLQLTMLEVMNWEFGTITAMLSLVNTVVARNEMSVTVPITLPI